MKKITKFSLSFYFIIFLLVVFFQININVALSACSQPIPNDCTQKYPDRTCMVATQDNSWLAGYYCESCHCGDGPDKCCKLIAGNPPAGNPPAGTVTLNNPLTGDTTSKSIPALLGTIIKYVMGVIGSLALVMFIYGGATWMLSGGNQEMVTKGKNILIWATMGIAIIFTAYALVKFVIETLNA